MRWRRRTLASSRLSGDNGHAQTDVGSKAGTEFPPFSTQVSAGESFRTIDPFSTYLETGYVWPVILVSWGAGSRCTTALAISCCPPPVHLWLIRAVLFSWSKAFHSAGSKGISGGKSRTSILSAWKKRQPALQGRKLRP